MSNRQRTVVRRRNDGDGGRLWSSLRVAKRVGWHETHFLGKLIIGDHDMNVGVERSRFGNTTRNHPSKLCLSSPHSPHLHLQQPLNLLLQPFLRLWVQIPQRAFFSHFFHGCCHFLAGSTCRFGQGSFHRNRESDLHSKVRIRVIIEQMSRKETGHGQFHTLSTKT